MPIQAPPTRRPSFIPPHTVIDLEHGDAVYLVETRMALVHGANFNDPCHFAWPGYERMKTT